MDCTGGSTGAVVVVVVVVGRFESEGLVTARRVRLSTSFWYSVEFVGSCTIWGYESFVVLAVVSLHNCSREAQERWLRRMHRRMCVHASLVLP